MTPEYASPEQIRGEPITTATDVYSLGVVLYQLLTGHSPYRFDTRRPTNLAAAITNDEPERPSIAVQRTENLSFAGTSHDLNPENVSSTREASPFRLQQRVQGDLDFILLKAFRKEPARRYVSVDQFDQYIRNHLEGLPVTARKGTWSYRAGKFIQRHKASVTAAALVLLTLITGIIVTLREARIAEANHRRAEKRFNDVRKLANSFLFEFHDAIEHLQGSTPARELVVKRAVEYLDSLSQEYRTDASLRRELATAYERVGNVQGSPYRDNLGNTKGALESFQKAIALREQLVQSSPHDPDLRSEMARDYGEVGDVLSASGDLRAALDSYRKGLDVLASEPLPNMKTKIRTELLAVRYGVGLTESGDLAKAVETLQTAIFVIDELIKEDPSDRDNVRDKVVANIHLAQCYEQMRRLPEALAAHRVAYALAQSLLQPGNEQSRRDVTVANEGIANILQKMGDKRGSLAIRLSILAEDRAAAQADPSDALLRRDIYTDYEKLASAQSALGAIRDGLSNQRNSVALNEAEVAANPASAMARKDLETNYFRLGEILRKAKQDGQALGYFQKVHATVESLSETDPKDLGIRADLSEIEMNLSDLQLTMGHGTTALAGYKQALSIAESVAAANPANAEWRIVLARLNQKLGEYYAFQAAKKRQPAQRATDREEALRWYRKSADLWNELQQRSALGPDYADKPAEVAREIANCAAPSTLHH